MHACSLRLHSEEQFQITTKRITDSKPKNMQNDYNYLQVCVCLCVLHVHVCMFISPQTVNFLKNTDNMSFIYIFPT